MCNINYHLINIFRLELGSPCIFTTQSCAYLHTCLVSLLARFSMWWSYGRTWTKARPVSQLCQSFYWPTLCSALGSVMSLTAVCDTLRCSLQRRRVRAWQQVGGKKQMAHIDLSSLLIIPVTIHVLMLIIYIFSSQYIVCDIFGLYLFFSEGTQGPTESKSGIQIKLYCVHTKWVPLHCLMSNV